MNRRDRVQAGTRDAEIQAFKALLRNPTDDEALAKFVETLKGQRGRGQAGTAGAVGQTGSGTAAATPFHPFLMLAR